LIGNIYLLLLLSSQSADIRCNTLIRSLIMVIEGLILFPETLQISQLRIENPTNVSNIENHTTDLRNYQNLTTAMKINQNYTNVIK